MTLLKDIKEKVNSVFDFYLQFQRRKFWALLGTFILIALAVILCVLLCTFLINLIMHPGSNSVDFLFNNGSLGWLLDSSQTVIFITLFTYSLAPAYFYDLRKSEDTPLFVARLRNLSGKKIGHYFTFIFIIILLGLVPEPTPYYDMFSYFPDYEYSGFTFFLYKWLKLLIYLLGMVFCYILINKDKVDFSTLYNERKIITVSILVFFMLSLIEIAVHSTADNYIGSIASPGVKVTVIVSLIVACGKIAFSSLIIPAQIIAMSTDEEAIRKVSNNDFRSGADDIIDEFEEIV